MEFTYDAYIKLISLLKENDYVFSTYDNYHLANKCVIMRHDEDNSIEKALELAEIENDLGVKSTYFILLSTGFYNIAEKRTLSMVRRIEALGHEIGLHFDETKYDEKDMEENSFFARNVEHEAHIMEEIIGTKIKSVSMHRPSTAVLRRNLYFKDIVNSYSDVFFKEFKYVSDSRMQWKENVIDIIESQKYKKLHILTHAFCYGEKATEFRDILSTYIKEGSLYRETLLRENIRDFDKLF